MSMGREARVYNNRGGVTALGNYVEERYIREHLAEETDHNNDTVMFAQKYKEGHPNLIAPIATSKEDTVQDLSIKSNFALKSQQVAGKGLRAKNMEQRALEQAMQELDEKEKSRQIAIEKEIDLRSTIQASYTADGLIKAETQDTSSELGNMPAVSYWSQNAAKGIVQGMTQTQADKFTRNSSFTKPLDERLE